MTPSLTDKTAAPPPFASQAAAEQAAQAFNDDLAQLVAMHKMTAVYVVIAADIVAAATADGLVYTLKGVASHGDESRRISLADWGASYERNMLLEKLEEQVRRGGKKRKAKKEGT